MSNETQGNYPTRIDLVDGKYTVIIDMNNGVFKALRYGKEWRSLAGDKMVLAMFDKIVELQGEIACLRHVASAGQPAVNGGREPEGWQLVRKEYEACIGEAAQRYFDSFGPTFAVRTPALFRFHELWSVMLAAEATRKRISNETWRSHDSNDGMRYPEESDLAGGATDCPE